MTQNVDIVAQLEANYYQAWEYHWTPIQDDNGVVESNIDMTIFSLSDWNGTFSVYQRYGKWV